MVYMRLALLFADVNTLSYLIYHTNHTSNHREPTHSVHTNTFVRPIQTLTPLGHMYRKPAPCHVRQYNITVNICNAKMCECVVSEVSHLLLYFSLSLMF